MAEKDRDGLSQIGKQLEEVSNQFKNLEQTVESSKVDKEIEKKAKNVLKLNNEMIKNHKLTQDYLTMSQKKLQALTTKIEKKYNNAQKIAKKDIEDYLNNFYVVKLLDKTTSNQNELARAMYEPSESVKKKMRQQGQNVPNYKYVGLLEDNEFKPDVIQRYQQMAIKSVEKIYKKVLKEFSQQYTLDQGDMDLISISELSHHKNEMLYKTMDSVIDSLMNYKDEVDESISISSDMKKMLIQFHNEIKNKYPKAIKKIDEMYAEAGIAFDNNYNFNKIYYDEKPNKASVSIPFDSKTNIGTIHTHAILDTENHLRQSSADIESALKQLEKLSIVYSDNSYIIMDFTKIFENIEQFADQNISDEKERVKEQLETMYVQIGKQIRNHLEKIMYLFGGEIQVKENGKIQNAMNFSQFDKEINDMAVNLYTKAMATVLEKFGGMVYKIDMNGNNDISVPKRVPTFSKNDKELMNYIKVAKHKTLINKNIDPISQISNSFLNRRQEILDMKNSYKETSDVQEGMLLNTKTLTDSQHKYYNEIKHSKEELKEMIDYLKILGNTMPDDFASMVSFEIPKEWENMLDILPEFVKISHSNYDIVHSIASMPTKSMDLFLSWCIDAVGGIEFVRDEYEALENTIRESVIGPYQLFNTQDDRASISFEIDDLSEEFEKIYETESQVNNETNEIYENYREKAGLIYFYLRQLSEIIDVIEEKGSDITLTWLDEVLQNKNTFNLLEQMLSVNKNDLISWNAYSKDDIDGIDDFILGVKSIVENIDYAKKQILELNQVQDDVLDDMLAYDDNIRRELKSIQAYAKSAIENYYNPLAISVDTLIDRAKVLNEFWVDPFDTTNNRFFEDMIRNGESAGDVLERIKEYYGWFDDDDLFDSVESSIDEFGTQAENTTNNIIDMSERFSQGFDNIATESQNMNSELSQTSDIIDEANTKISTFTKKTKEEFQEVCDSTLRIISEIGISYDELIAKINHEYKTINGNQFRERLYVIDENNKVVESLIGKAHSLGLPSDYELPPGRLMGHTHSKDKGSSYSDTDYETMVALMTTVKDGAMYLNGSFKQFELRFNESASILLDFANMIPQQFVAAFHQLLNINKLTFMKTDPTNSGMILPLFYTSFDKITNGLLKYVMEKFGGSVSFNGVDFDDKYFNIGMERVDMQNMQSLLDQITLAIDTNRWMPDSLGLDTYLREMRKLMNSSNFTDNFILFPDLDKLVLDLSTAEKATESFTNAWQKYINIGDKISEIMEVSGPFDSQIQYLFAASDLITSKIAGLDNLYYRLSENQISLGDSFKIGISDFLRDLGFTDISDSIVRPLTDMEVTKLLNGLSEQQIKEMADAWLKCRRGLLSYEDVLKDFQKEYMDPYLTDDVFDAAVIAKERPELLPIFDSKTNGLDTFIEDFTNAYNVVVDNLIAIDSHKFGSKSYTELHQEIDDMITKYKILEEVSDRLMHKTTFSPSLEWAQSNLLLELMDEYLGKIGYTIQNDAVVVKDMDNSYLELNRDILTSIKYLSLEDVTVENITKSVEELKNAFTQTNISNRRNGLINILSDIMPNASEYLLSDIYESLNRSALESTAILEKSQKQFAQLVSSQFISDWKESAEYISSLFNAKDDKQNELISSYVELQEKLANAVRNASIEQENYAEALPVAYNVGITALKRYESEATAVWNILKYLLGDNIEKYAELKNAIKGLYSTSSTTELIEDHHRLGEAISDNEVILDRFSQTLKNIADKAFFDQMNSPMDKFINNWVQIEEKATETAEAINNTSKAFEKFERIDGEVVYDGKLGNNKNSNITDAEDELKDANKQTAKSFNEETKAANETSKAMDNLAKKKKKPKKSEDDLRNANQQTAESFNEETESAQRTATELHNIDDVIREFRTRYRQGMRILDTDDDKHIQSYILLLEEATEALGDLFNNRRNRNEVSDEDIENMRQYINLVNSANNKENRTGTYLELQKYQAKIADYLYKNTNMSDALRSQFRGLNDEIQDMINNQSALGERVTELKRQFLSLTTIASRSGQLGKSFFDKFTTSITQANINFIRMYASWYDWIRYIRMGIETVIDLDTALIDLKKTTTMTDSQLEGFYSDANNLAKRLGVTTEEIINQAAAWSRLGYSSKEAVTTMAELSSQFASISPGMDTDTAQSGLVSIMKAWDISIDDVERKIMDNINTLGNKFAETNADIIEGMEKAAATFSALGQTPEDTFALFTGAQEIQQNAETVGTALKTLSLRIRGYSEETEELDDELVNISGKVIDLTKTASRPNGVSLFTDTSQTEYRSMVSYLRDISEIWDEIDAKSQTELLDKLFGKRGASVGAAIVKNFDSVERALIEMTNATGSADKEMGIIEESLEYKINALKETWVGFAQQLIDSGSLGNIIDGLTALSEVLQGLASIPLSSIISFFVALNASGIINKVTGLSSLSQEFEQLYSAFNTSGQQNFATWMQQYGTTASPFIRQFSENLEDNVDILQQWNSQIGSLRIDRLNLLRQSLISFGKGLAISATISVVISSIYKLVNASKEFREELSKLSNDYSEIANSIDDYKTKINKLKSVINNEKSSIDEIVEARASLLDIQSEMIEQYKNEPGAIDVITNSIGLQNDAVIELTDNLDVLSESKFWDLYKELNKFNLFTWLGNLEEGYSNNTEAMIGKMNPALLSERFKNDYVSDFASQLSTVDVMDDMFGSYLVVSGNIEDVLSDLNELKQFIKDNKLENDDTAKSLYEYLEKQIFQLKQDIYSFQDMYDAYVLYTEIMPDAEYSSQLSNIEELKKIYDEALINDDNTDVAASNLAKAILNGIELAEQRGDTNVLNYLKHLYPLIQNEISEWNFKIDFETNEPELNQQITDAVNTLTDRGFSLEDIANGINVTEMLGEGDTSSNALYAFIKNAASQYGMDISELLNLLHEDYKLGKTNLEKEVQKYISENAYNQLLSSGDLSILTSYSGGIEILTSNLKKFDTEEEAVKQTIIDITNAQKANSLAVEEQITKVSSMTDGMDKLKDIYADVKDKGTFDFTLLDEKDFKETFQNMSGYAEFMDTISNNPRDIEKCTTAFNKLVTSYLHSTGVLDSVTDATASVTTAMLENMGIVNAEELVQQQLVSSYEGLGDAMEELGIKADNLSELTDKDLEALYSLESASEETCAALLRLMLQRNLVNQYDIKTANSCLALANLVGASSECGKALTEIAELMIEINRIQGEVLTNDNLDEVTRRFYEKSIAAHKRKIESIKNTISFDSADYTVNYDPSSNIKDGGSNSDKDFDWIKVKIERLESEIEKLDEVVSSAYTNYEEKLDALAKKSELLTQKTELQTIAAEKYRELAEEVPLDEQYKKLVQEGGLNIDTITDSDLKDQIERYQERWEAYLDALKEVRAAEQAILDNSVEQHETSTGELERLRNNGAITEKQYIAGLKAAYTKYYKNKKGLELQYREAVIETLKLEQSYLESVASAAASVIQKQIDELENQRDAQLEPLNEQIKALEAAKKPLEDQLDDMEKQRAAREEQLALEKALYNLRRAEAQRTKLTYKNGQMVYSADDSAIKDARDAVDDAEYDIQKRKIQDQIDAIDDQIDALNDDIDRINDNYDKQIKGLEKLANAWQQAIDDITNAQNIALLKEYFGDDGAITKLLSGEINPDTGWTKDYIGTLVKLSEADGKGITATADELARLYGLKAGDFLNDFSTIKDAATENEDAITSLSDAIGAGGSSERQKTSETAEGQSQGETKSSSTGLTSAMETAGTTGETAINSLSDAIYNTAIPAIQAETEFMNEFNKVAGEEITKKVTIEYSSNGGPISGKASGGDINKTGEYLVGELGEELVVHSDGSYETVGVRGAETTNLRKGDIVFNADDTEELKKTGHINSRGKALANGNAKFVSLSEANPEKYSMLTKLTTVLTGNNGLVNTIGNINNTLKDVLRDVSQATTNTTPAISFGDINVSCTGVTSQEVINTISDTLEKSFSGLALNAYQRSKSRN